MNLIEQDMLQRQSALDAGKSFIVQAPAGSGKTELLIQRFLTLLNHVKAPEEILAITFTKKAANEMRARVIKALKQSQSDPAPESKHAKQTWTLGKLVLERDKQFNWNLINNPNQLRIQTIDSLCSNLTRQLPLLSHFGSQPEIADNPAGLYREAVQEVLMHVEENFAWSRAISDLLLHLDNDLNKLHELLVNLLAKRDQWLPYIHFNSSDAAIKTQLEQHLAAVIKESLSTVKKLFPREIINSLIPIIRYAADNLALAKPDSVLLACRNLSGLPGTDPEDKQYWLSIAKFLLTEKNEWRKSYDARIGIPAVSGLKNANEKALAGGFKEKLIKLIAEINSLDELRLALAELEYLPEPHYQPAQWEVLQSLLQVLKIVAAQLRVTFQLHGQIDFIENAQAALAALGNSDTPTDLALALDYQIRHILVDEFQDTSLSQYQLLEKLITGWEQNDGRTLFVVGDPMQSIYRFREAEVGLFIRMRSHGIGNIKLIPLTLSVNFRSTANIVEWNNHHYQRIFPTFNDMATGAVTYSPSVSIHDGQDANSRIQIKGFTSNNENVQVHNIISLIEETKRQYPDEKIAILVRSRPHLKDIIPVLKQANISYRAVEIDPLASRQTIQDLLSLTRALLHPADRIAWLAILRAPWCGLTLADLLVIAGTNPYAAIWEQLEHDHVIKQLSADGQTRLKRILPILKIKIAERERYNLRLWVESTWILLGGPACLPDIAEMDDANAYFKLLDKFSQQDLTLNIDNLKEKIEALYAAAEHNDASVQIMTIHSAKGLEFDTVILPHLENKPANDTNSLLLWMERPLTNDQIALLLAPIHATGTDKDYIYEYVNRQHSIKTNYEIDRLLYVATTRAKMRLHLFFNAEIKDKGDIKLESGSFLKKIWPHIETQQHTVISNEQTPLENTQSHMSTARSIMRVSSTWNNPITNARMHNTPAHHKQSGFQLTDPKPKIIGVVIHRILQQIAQHGVSWWTNTKPPQINTYLTHQLLQQGLSQEDLASAIGMTQRAITNTLNDKRGQWILQKHHQAKSEFAISAVVNDEIMNLVIDRTFIDEHGIRWIIDYKSAAFSHDDLERFLAKEQKKYLEQMQTYQQAMRLVEDKPIKLGLYFPVLPAWKEWE